MAYDPDADAHYSSISVTAIEPDTFSIGMAADGPGQPAHGIGLGFGTPPDDQHPNGEHTVYYLPAAMARRLTDALELHLRGEGW